MTTRPSVSRRIAAAVLGVEGPRGGLRDVTARRELPYGRRLLAAVFGVRAGTRQTAALPAARALIDEAGESPAEAPVETLTEPRARAARPRPQPHPQGEKPERPTTQVTPLAPGAVAPDSPPHPPVGSERSWDSVGPDEPPPHPPLHPPRKAYAGARVRSTPQHLLTEDRQEYERILDEALRSAPHRPDLAAVGRRLNPEQLRTMALNATALITSAAATEYQHYVSVREELRGPREHARESDATEAEPAGAGAAAVVAVLAPVLAGTAATIFLGVGFLLKLVGRASSFSSGLITTGWLFGAVTAAAILVAAVGLLLSALRNGPRTETEAYSELSDEVDQARESWRAALLEHGILPFLQDALTDPGTASARHRVVSLGRIPQLGYGRPDFSSPEDEPETGARPTFTSPDFTSPDFGGPEHEPE